MPRFLLLVFAGGRGKLRQVHGKLRQVHGKLPLARHVRGGGVMWWDSGLGAKYGAGIGVFGA